MNPTFCDCCFSECPSVDDGGGLGHICAECGWEQDSVENCLELAEWCREKYGDDPRCHTEGCTCHLNSPLWVSCGWSAANGETIRQARQAYYLTSPDARKEVIIRAVLVRTLFRR